MIMNILLIILMVALLMIGAHFGGGIHAQMVPMIACFVFALAVAVHLVARIKTANIAQEPVSQSIRVMDD